MSVVIRSAFSEKLRVSCFNDEPSMTKQSFKETCDVNNILKKYKRDNASDFFADHAGYFAGKFEDVSAAQDYHTALGLIDEARGVFEAMPAPIRARFANDPYEMLDFLQNPANREEAISLGFSSSVPSASVDAPTGSEG